MSPMVTWTRSAAASSMPRPSQRLLLTAARTCLHTGLRPQASSAPAAAPDTTPSKVLVSLERSIGERMGSDKTLWQTGAFGAAVYPDLPISTTWQGLFRAFGKGAPAAVQYATAGGAQPADFRVQTVGAQLRSAEQLQQLIRAACSGPAAADALLMVSGSHPLRSLPLMGSLLQYNSTWLLQEALALRAAGEIPHKTQLWAVANPVVEPTAALLERKVQAGAQVVLTQPPLDWTAFERWMADARARGLHSRAKLLIGIPMLTSAANAGFWLSLCGAYTNAAARQLVQQFQEQEQLPAQQLDGWSLQWNRQLVERVLGTAGVAGLHVMPITAKSRKQVQQLLLDGIIPDSATFRP